MFPDVSNFVDVNESSDISGELIVISDSKADGTFLIHHFLSLCLKRDSPVHFLALQQSFGHYNTVSQKCGQNLTKLRESGKLFFIEGLKSLGESIVSGSNNKKEGSGSTKICNKWPDAAVHNSSLRELFQYMRELVEKPQNDDCRLNPVIIVDDLTPLLSLGIPVKELLIFVHYMKSEFIYKSRGTVVLYTSGDAEAGDDDQDLLWRGLCHASSLQLQVTGLPSGYLKDVQGEISMVRKQPISTDNRAAMKVEPVRKIQFRVTDRDVSCFAIGTSSVVL